MVIRSMRHKLCPDTISKLDAAYMPKLTHTLSSQNVIQLSLPIDTITCQHYEPCAAPLCPKDVNLGNRIWFPGEAVCRLRSSPEWVRKQRKIARLTGTDPNLCFSYRMLNTLQRIGRDAWGATPEHLAAERRWFVGRFGRRAGKKAEKTNISKPGCEREPQEKIRTYPLC